MRKWEVTVYMDASCHVIVEANSAEEAEEKAVRLVECDPFTYLNSDQGYVCDFMVCYEDTCCLPEEA